LSPKQEAAALALAAGESVSAAARSSNAGERTIKEWTATVPAFGRRVSELRADMTNRAIGRLVDGMSAAADTLKQLLSAESETVRLSAARATLELGSKMREAGELEARLAALEAAQEGRPR
jgi:hypothetical protein